MTDGYLLGEDEVRRTAEAVRADEALRAKPRIDSGTLAANRQLHIWHKLPSDDTTPAKVHVALESEGFDFAELHMPCSDTELVEVRTTDQKKFTANETAFFEGTLFEQEIAPGMVLEGQIYLVGGSHTTVTGTKVTEDGVMYVELEDCPLKRVQFEWLTAPTEDVPDGAQLIALYVKAKGLYVAVLIACEDET